MIRRIYVLSVLCVLGSNVAAEEAQTSLHSTVSGSHEQPRVMYIVPWQQPVDGELSYELQNTISAELFTPADRYEFNRAMAYRDLLDEDKTETDVASAPEQETQ